MEESDGFGRDSVPRVCRHARRRTLRPHGADATSRCFGSSKHRGRSGAQNPRRVSQPPIGGAWIGPGTRDSHHPRRPARVSQSISCHCHSRRCSRSRATHNRTRECAKPAKQQSVRVNRSCQFRDRCRRPVVPSANCPLPTAYCSPSRKAQRYKFGRVLPRSDGHDHVLFAPEHVRHRRAGRAGGKLRLPQHLTRDLVERSKLTSTGAW